MRGVKNFLIRKMISVSVSASDESEICDFEKCCCCCCCCRCRCIAKGYEMMAKRRWEDEEEADEDDEDDDDDENAERRAAENKATSWSIFRSECLRNYAVRNEMKAPTNMPSLITSVKINYYVCWPEPNRTAPIRPICVCVQRRLVWLQSIRLSFMRREREWYFINSSSFFLRFFVSVLFRRFIRILILSFISFLSINRRWIQFDAKCKWIKRQQTQTETASHIVHICVCVWKKSRNEKHI